MIAETTGVDGRRDKCVSQRVHLDERDEAAGITMIKGVLAFG